MYNYRNEQWSIIDISIIQDLAKNVTIGRSIIEGEGIFVDNFSNQICSR